MSSHNELDNWEHGGDALGAVKDGSSCDEMGGCERGCDPLGTVKGGSFCDELVYCLMVHHFLMSRVTVFPLGAVLHKTALSLCEYRN